MTLQVPVAIYGPPFRHRACIRYSIIWRVSCTYGTHGTVRMPPNPGTLLKYPVILARVIRVYILFFWRGYPGNSMYDSIFRIGTNVLET